jgi:[ribosomal protein S5]-alanine N-acetyltransferase
VSDIKPLNDIPVLCTERLMLRKLTVSDASDVFEYAHVPEVTKFLVWYPHKTKDDSLEFIAFAEKKFNEESDIVWGIECMSEKKIIGTIGLLKWNDINKCGEIGYCISKKYWGKGIMTEAF